jgi:deoxyhypusine synthase
MSKGAISQFIVKNYRHFNAATLVDAAQAYEAHIQSGGQMLITLAGAMSTAELGISLAEMIRQGKVQAICCTGANLEEDVFNLVAHDFYKRVPQYRYLTAADEWKLLEGGFNRVTDTCIPEEEAIRRIEKHIHELWKKANDANMSFCINCFEAGCSNNIIKFRPNTVGFWPLASAICRFLYRVGKIRLWEIFLLPIVLPTI